MAWRQSPGGSEQHLTLAAAAARTRTQRPGKHLAVHASELVVKSDFQILRRYRRPLLLRLEHTHRPTLEDYVHRATRLGSSRSLNLRIGISHSPKTSFVCCPSSGEGLTSGVRPPKRTGQPGILNGPAIECSIVCMIPRCSKSASSVSSIVSKIAPAGTPAPPSTRIASRLSC